MLATIYIPRVENHMKLAVQKNQLQNLINLTILVDGNIDTNQIFLVNYDF